MKKIFVTLLLAFPLLCLAGQKTTEITEQNATKIERWCWHTEDTNMRLYFKDDETASAFSFQWS